MDRYDIGRCLAYHLGDVESGVVCDATRVRAFCDGSARCLPTIPVVPPATGEGPAPEELVAGLRAQGVAAVRVFPRAHGFDFVPWSMGPLLEVLQEHRIPVIHHSGDLNEHAWDLRPDWEDLHSTARAFPDLPIIVLWIGMQQNRRLFPLLARCPNIITDLSNVSFQYVEDVFGRFGPNRLVLASHHPYEDPGIYTTQISYAGLSDAERDNLAHGCVDRLLEGRR